MSRQLISTGSPFEAANAYSRAVVDGDWCFVAGTTGFDYATMQMPERAADQARQALETIRTTLESAGFVLADIVRVQYLLITTDDIDEVAPVLREYFGEIRPAATMTIVGLVDPSMRIEIEVTARRS